MCNKACIEFGKKNLRKEDVKRKTVIEVGALDVNGSLRPDIEALDPAIYIGIDLHGGQE